LFFTSVLLGHLGKKGMQINDNFCYPSHIYPFEGKHFLAMLWHQYISPKPSMKANIKNFLTSIAKRMAQIQIKSLIC
jgi:hypothetical protein